MLIAAVGDLAVVQEAVVLLLLLLVILFTARSVSDDFFLSSSFYDFFLSSSFFSMKWVFSQEYLVGSPRNPRNEERKKRERYIEK